MKIKVEASGLKIGVDNSVTDAIRTGNWGIRLRFENNQNDGIFEACLTEDEAKSLISELQLSLFDIRKVKQLVPQQLPPIDVVSITPPPENYYASDGTGI